MMLYKKSIIILFIFMALVSGSYLYLDSEVKVLDSTTRANLPGSFISLDLGVVHYEIKGSSNAPVIVLVHGFSIPSYVWQPTFDALVSQGYRVLRYDLYGRGFSDRPASDYGMALYVSQLDQLLTALDINAPVDLVGLSMGGAIVTHFTNRYAGRVRKVSLIDPLVATPYRLDVTAIKVPVLGEYLAKTVIIPKIRRGLDQAVYDLSTFPDWKEKFDPQTLYQGFAMAILSTARYLDGKSFVNEYERLGALKIPVQLFWGRQDLTIPFADSEKVKAAIPHVDFIAIDQAGHLPHYEHPQLVNAQLIRFLEG